MHFHACAKCMRARTRINPMSILDETRIDGYSINHSLSSLATTRSLSDRSHSLNYSKCASLVSVLLCSLPALPPTRTATSPTPALRYVAYRFRPCTRNNDSALMVESILNLRHQLSFMRRHGSRCVRKRHECLTCLMCVDVQGWEQSGESCTRTNYVKAVTRTEVQYQEVVPNQSCPKGYSKSTFRIQYPRIIVRFCRTDHSIV